MRTLTIENLSTISQPTGNRPYNKKRIYASFSKTQWIEQRCNIITILWKQKNEWPRRLKGNCTLLWGWHSWVVKNCMLRILIAIRDNGSKPRRYTIGGYMSVRIQPFLEYIWISFQKILFIRMNKLVRASYDFAHPTVLKWYR